MNEIESTQGLEAGTIVLTGSTYYLVEGVSRRSFTGKVWSYVDGSWGSSKTVPLPSPCHPAYVADGSLFPN